MNDSTGHPSEAPRRYSFREGEIVSFRSLHINSLQRQKNEPFLEGEEKGDLGRGWGKPQSGCETIKRSRHGDAKGCHKWF